MATSQAIAIREELAIERIRVASETLKARTGAEFVAVDLSGRINAAERQAVTLEQIADILEALAGVISETIEVEKEHDEDGTEQVKRRPNPRRKAETPSE